MPVALIDRLKNFNKVTTNTPAAGAHHSSAIIGRKPMTKSDRKKEADEQLSQSQCSTNTNEDAEGALRIACVVLGNEIYRHIDGCRTALEIAVARCTAAAQF